MKSNKRASARRRAARRNCKNLVEAALAEYEDSRSRGYDPDGFGTMVRSPRKAGSITVRFAPLGPPVELLRG